MSDEQIETPRKKPGRPPKAIKAAVAQTGFAPSMEQWADLMDKLTSNKQLDIENAAIINAQAMKKALRPENELHPGISVYNPRGEQKYPRPKPTQIYMLAKYPICDPGNYDTTTYSELELLNQLKPGIYPITKSDGLTVNVLVKTEYDGADRPYKTTLFADGKGIQDDEQRQNWQPLMQILTEMVTGEGPTQSYARYQARIDALEAKLAAVSAA